MRAAAIKLKRQIDKVNIINNDIQKKAFYFILWSFAVLSVCYVVFLSVMVFNIVERRSLESEALTLSNQVGDMELTYLSLSNKIDLPSSYALGFKTIQPSFAVRKSLGSFGSLKINNNEI